VVTDGGRRLRLADDAQGQQLWPTPEDLAQQERQRAEREQAAREHERQRAEQAEAELAELRRQLAALQDKQEK
jgi:hypothetical protein